jgi:diguanylate cyclase (GGDEF)-like protein
VISVLKDRDPRALAMGGLALLVGIAAVVADLPLLGLAAGVLALGIAVLVPRDTPTVSTRPAPAPAAVPAPSPVTPAPSALASATAGAEAPAPAGRTYTPAASSPLTDPVTGLFNGEYFRVAVETRVLAARRHLRPVAVVLFDVFEGPAGGEQRRSDPLAVAAAIKDTLREADTACRLDDGRFAFVLEDTPEDGAIWTVERVRRALQQGGVEGQVRWAGIACYPAHAFSADEALSKAEGAFAAAREWAQDRIEVAHAD